MANWTNPSKAGAFVAYKEKTRSPASPQTAIGNNSSQAIRTFLLAWDQQQNYATTILGYPFVATAGATKFVSRVTPFPNPDWEGGAQTFFMYATAIKAIRPVGAPSDGFWKSTPPVPGAPVVARWLYGEADILFDSLPYDILPDSAMPVIPGTMAPDDATLLRMTEFLPKPAAEYLSLPEGCFKISGTQIPVPGRPGKIVPKNLWLVTQHQVPKEAIGDTLINPQLNNPYISQMIGRVNKDPFPPGSANPYPPGTLLYLAPEYEYIRSPFGDRLVNIRHRIEVLQVIDRAGNIRGHNWLFCRNATTLFGLTIDTSGYYEVTSTGVSNLPGATPTPYADNVNIYGWGTLANCFRVPPN
jgi:hypothetical protein